MTLEDGDIQQLTNMLANAMQQAIAQATQSAVASIAQHGNGAEGTSQSAVVTLPKPPQFSIPEYINTETSSVSSYFERFECAAKLSKIPETEYNKYALVYMGAHLIDALKILIHPEIPETCTFEKIKITLINHFDRKKNKFAESVKFRQLSQNKGESVSSFVLRLRQAATSCEYGDFFDRMLIEQLIVGIDCRSTCDEIISKKPNSFNEAYEIAQALEATRHAAITVKTNTFEVDESTNKLGYEPVQFKKKTRVSTNRNQEFNKNGARAPIEPCHSCGGKHLRTNCKLREATCFSCGKKGHIAKICKSRANQIDDTDSVQDHDDINKIQSNNTKKGMISTHINGCAVTMELDTGAPCGIISKTTFKKIKPGIRLKKTDRQFSSYTGHKIPCLGKAPVVVKVGKTSRKLNVYVMDGEFDCLFGREWIAQFANEIKWTQLFSNSDQVKAIKLDTPKLNKRQEEELQRVLDDFKNIFSESAGKLIGPPAKCHLKPGVTPIFSKARDIPLALRDTYAAEIDSKIASGIFKRVDYSEWASTTHVVTKKNGKIRITGNYKPTLNPRMIIDEHPIPKAEMLLNKMKNAKIFCHLDITDAYSHLTIDEEFGHLLTLNTITHGLIRPTRAVYGAANIPAIWQRRMESMLLDLPNVCSFFDDILIYATDFDQLIITLRNTLQCLKNQGVKLNKSKCVFAAPAVEFLGHKIDAQGIHKSDTHIKAVRDAAKPASVEELQLFLGKASYYNSFIKDLSTRNRPLRDILKKEQFKWTDKADRAYTDIKNALISSEVLMPYDPTLPLLLATDASKVGLGAVLSHRLEDGQERPIAYASRTLTTAEQKYPQMDKEALAIVWAVQKFFLYVYARHWTLITDHKPLAQILHPHKSLPVLCISRMANYADFLGNFDFDVVFKSTKENANADYCSRALTTKSVYNIRDGKGNIIRQIQQLPVRAHRIAKETRSDEHLGIIVKHLESGKNLQKLGYKSPQINYKLMDGCLLYEHRVVIPLKLQEILLKNLHSGHLGIVKMKGLARSFIYWPGLDSDIEDMANRCDNCSKNAHNPQKYKGHHWEYPKRPWERIHIDYAGPFAETMLLIVSDAYSKWLEVKVTNSSTAAATISILDELFATYGVPVTLVSDNGTNFKSEEFKNFLSKVGVQYHKTTAPYHLATNGQAERSVQTVKNATKAMDTRKATLQSNLNEFLRQYRRAPHSTTGQSPSQQFLGRALRTRLDLIFPKEPSTAVMERQQIGNNNNFRSFQQNQKVWFRSNNPRDDKWVQGIIIKKLGDLHYEIEYEGKIHKRHVNQIQKQVNDGGEERSASERNKEGTTLEEQIEVDESDQTVTRRRHFYPENNQTITTNNDTIITHDNDQRESEMTVQHSAPVWQQPDTESTSPSGTPVLRKSTRHRKPCVRYSP